MFGWESYNSCFPIYTFPQVEAADYSPSHLTSTPNTDNSALLDRIKQLEFENQRLKKEVCSLQAKRIPVQKRKIKRRPENQLKKNLKCLFFNCKKQYASTLALNLHMKLKHNAGTKREREKLARQVIEAENKNKQRPNISIEFPPNYVEELKKRHTAECKLQNLAVSEKIEEQSEYSESE